LARVMQNPSGRLGIIVPSGIATDDTTKFFFQDLTERRTLISLYDFENRKGLFPAVDSRMKFCLLTITGAARPELQGAEFVFFALGAEDLGEADRRFRLSAGDIFLLNPNTRTCPIFRGKRDAELTKGIFRRVSILINEVTRDNPWGITFKQGLFNMASDSTLFRSREQLEAEGWRLQSNWFVRGDAVYLPLYEAKMANMFDHRAAHVVLSATAVMRQGQPDRLDACEHANPNLLPQPRYWVDATQVIERLGRRQIHGFLGFTDVTSPTNERTMIASILPFVGVGHTMPLILSSSTTTVDLPVG
jgi:hypothetical protein